MNRIDEIRKKQSIDPSIRIYSTNHFMVYVGIEEREGSKFVMIYAPLYVNKVREFSVCYSLGHSDYQILKCHYLTKHLTNSYGEGE